MSIIFQDTTTEAPFVVNLEFDTQGRIARKTETVKGKPPRNLWYYYDDDKLSLVDSAPETIGGELEMYRYDNQDRRIASAHAGSIDTWAAYHYDDGDRLLGVNSDRVRRNADGFRNERWCGGQCVERYEYSSDFRLLRVEKNGKVIEFDHDEDGFRCAKYLNGQLVETYEWHTRSKMDRCNIQGVEIDFAYLEDDDINPAFMLYGDNMYSLWYDQVGSLRVVADELDNVVKEITYDSFGRILKETNPAMRVPIGFGGGLPDPDVGWVRMGYRDYDPQTGRFTAKDPLGSLPGYSDVYDYCADDPINLIDPEGLKPKEASESGGFWDAAGESLLRLLPAMLLNSSWMRGDLRLKNARNMRRRLGNVPGGKRRRTSRKRRMSPWLKRLSRAIRTSSRMLSVARRKNHLIQGSSTFREVGGNKTDEGWINEALEMVGTAPACIGGAQFCLGLLL